VLGATVWVYTVGCVGCDCMRVVLDVLGATVWCV